MFETPFTSLLSKNTVLLYPSLAPGYVPEFYVNPYRGEGYFIFSRGDKKLSFGSMLYSGDSTLVALFGLRKNENSIGFTLDYSSVNEGINAISFSFSHRTPEYGYDLGLLYDRRVRDLLSAYVRGFWNINDMLDAVLGLRGFYEQDKAVSGFISAIFSPVSGQYLEMTLGYTPWMRQLYVVTGVSHQFYRNFALSMGFYYPLKDFEDVSRVSLSRFEVPSVFPSLPDFRVAFEFMDNSTVYNLGVGMDYSVLRSLIQSGKINSTPYTLTTGLSIYFYSF